jgi:signal transduction histidine kinase
MTEMLSITSALESLNRLKQAAPPTTASRLGQIMALIQSLAADNAFLSAQVAEDSSLLDMLPPPPFEPDVLPPPPPPFETDIADLMDNLTLEIIGGLSEALRAPLVAIRGRSELFHTGTSGQIADEQAQWLQSIEDNTNRAFMALDAMERLVALIRHEVQINWASFIATELLDEAQNRIRERVAHSHHEMSVHVPDIVPLAYGDFYQSLLILMDLLDNAVSYTAPGGHIRLTVESLGTHVLFSVIDNGIGLRPEDMEKVGKPFWRADHHPLVRYNTSGTGLSLFLAKQVLALQNGELICYGEPDLGSTFSFTLPTPT